MKQRIWEIDYFRGIAILLMVIFHLIVDLKDYFGFQVEYMTGFWYYEGKLSAIMFIFLAGVGSSLNSRAYRHGLKVLAAAVLVSAVTYVVNAETYVRFGILHLLGSAILLGPMLCLASVVILVCAAAVLLLAQVWVNRLTLDSGLLLPFGVTPADFITVDYYPLIPWLAVFLLGQAAGKRLYANRQPLVPQPRGTKIICLMGRHSLLIYLTHQPLMLAVLYLALR